MLFLFVLGSQEKEQQSLQKELLRELERFKAEEMARMDRKIEDSRDHMRREMEFLYTRNIHALNVKKVVHGPYFHCIALDIIRHTFSLASLFFIHRKQISISQPRMKNQPALFSHRQREIWTTTKSCSYKRFRNLNNK